MQLSDKYNLKKNYIYNSSYAMYIEKTKVSEICSLPYQDWTKVP